MQSLCGAQLYRQVSAYSWLGSFMVGDNKKQDNNSVELEASLAPAEAEVGAVAKADQKYFHICLIRSFWFISNKISHQYFSHWLELDY